MAFDLFGRTEIPSSVSKNPQSQQDILPIFRHTKMLVGVLIVVLLLLIGVFLVAGHSYYKFHTDASAWLLSGILAVILVVMAPLFWGIQIGLTFGPNGLKVGNGVAGANGVNEEPQTPNAKKTKTTRSTRTRNTPRVSTRKSRNSKSEIT